MHKPAYLVLLTPLVHPHGKFTSIGTIYSWLLRRRKHKERMYHTHNAILTTDKSNNVVFCGKQIVMYLNKEGGNKVQ